MLLRYALKYIERPIYICRNRCEFTFFAIQRILSSWPFRILQMRTGGIEGSSDTNDGGIQYGVRT
jgi:hypothetical protein